MDGANFFTACNALDLKVDYSRLSKWLHDNYNILRINYYTAVSEDENGVSRLKPLIDYLSYNGFNIVKKHAKEFTDANGKKFVKGNMDVEITVDAMELAEHIDHVVLFSGDGDFKYLIEAAQRKGVRVTVVSTIATNPPIAADELRKKADEFIDLDNIAEEIDQCIREN